MQAQLLLMQQLNALRNAAGMGGSPMPSNMMMAMPGVPGAPNPATKKQREVYFGNLTVGLVTPEMLTQLCNGALTPLCPDAATNPPVVRSLADSLGDAKRLLGDAKRLLGDA